MTADLSVFRFSSFDLPEDQAFETWRQIMARMFTIDKADFVNGLPRGGLSAFLLGDIMGNRSIFTAQHLSRDRRRIEATPDHLVLQLYRSGGFAGEIGGEAYNVSRGGIAICDLRRPLDVRSVTSSDTIGLSIPRHLLVGIDLERVPPRLDPVRERLLAARMTGLHRRLPNLTAAEAPAVTADLLAVLRRLLHPSTSNDVLESQEFDDDLLPLAEQVITAALGSHDLSPELIADRLRVSRATLYRAFAPVGGVMQHVWTMRLEAVRAALDQPARPMKRLAADYGFKTASHLTRSFRERYGAAPSDWRAQQAAESRDNWLDGPARLNDWWHDLGR